MIMNKKIVVTLSLLALVVAALLLSSAFGSATSMIYAQTDVSFIEPNAGAWQTWVLASGSELRPPAPPDRAATETELVELQNLVSKRDATALDQIAFWDTGAPTYRWNELTVNQALKNNMSVLTASRVLALVHAAMYDATVAAYDAKYTYNRIRPSDLQPSLQTVIPNPRTPAYVSEHSAVAGAASTVLAYLFPDNAKFYADQAEAAAQSRLLAGVEYPSDVAAGLALGRAVGAKVVERAKNDGSNAKWTGTVPTATGTWTGTNPVLPTLGTWKTWVLESGDEFRPAPPPAYDSAAMAKEMAELTALERTPKQTADAYFWEYGAGGLRGYWFWNDQTIKKIFEYGLDTNGPRAARVLALESIAYYDSAVACWDAKYEYWAIRPFQLDPNFEPLFTTPNHPSYPSGHACVSASAADVLAYLFPRDENALKALAENAADSRIWAGIHFRSDADSGLKLGRDVAQKVIEHAQNDGSQQAIAKKQ
jgi:membrane-associated phospholipid phosphatase